MNRLFSLLIVVFCTTFLSAQLDRSVPPKAGPAPLINIGSYNKFKLSNGLKVFVVEDHTLPFVSYSLSLEIDPILEGNAAGYVTLAGSLMQAGTKDMTKAEIDEAIDFIGADLYTYSDGIYARSLKKHSETLLKVMSDVLQNPVFPQEELDKNILQIKSSLQADKSDASAIARNVSDVLRYGKNDPYGELVSEETIENVTVEHLQNYHRTYFRPNIAYLVIVGDIKLKEAKKQAKKYFGKWEKVAVPSHSYTLPPVNEGLKIALANRKGANQSAIRIGHYIDLTPGHPDAIKAALMNQLLGGGSFNARLFQNLREDKAYTYGAYSRLNSDKRLGYFEVSTEVRTSVTDSAIYEILYEMKRMQMDTVSEEELELTKNVMIGNFSRSLENSQTIAAFALNIERFNLPSDYYRTYLEKIAAVTSEDIREMANKYLKPDNAVVVAVGDIAKIKELLKRFFPDNEVLEYDFYGNVIDDL